jgi:hypothetical protein
MRADMRRQRPTSILVIAILHLVGGGLGLLFALCGLGGIVLSSAVSSAVPTFALRLFHSIIAERDRSAPCQSRMQRVGITLGEEENCR